MRNRKVLKMENLMKATFYFLGVNKEDICVEGTQ